MLQQSENGRLLVSNSESFRDLGDVIDEQRSKFTETIEAHRREWLFSDFLTVLQQLSEENSNMNHLTFLNKPCFSSALNEITEVCQSILNNTDTPPSPPSPLNDQDPPSSLVFNEASLRWTSVHDEFTIRSTQNPTLSSHFTAMDTSTESEDTHLSTQISDLPSPENDQVDIDLESPISPAEQRKKSCLRILTLIHDIRSRPTDPSETDWDITPFIEQSPTLETKEVTRAHFDHTIFDSVDQYDIVRLLDESNAIFRETGNLSHLSLTQEYFTKLTHFILSETGDFGELAADHLWILLEVVPNQREIWSTVFPLLRNTFHRTNENACYSLLWIIVKELEMTELDSVLLASWTDADWIVFFSHRWIRLDSVRLFLGLMIAVLRATIRYRQSPSTSNLSLARLFSVNNNVIARSETLMSLFSQSGYLHRFKSHSICAVSLCFAAHNEPLPSSIHDAIIHLYDTGNTPTIIPRLLTVLLPFKHEIVRFLSSFPAEFVIEKELSRMLVLFDEKSWKELILLCGCFAPENLFIFLHPFILRGLGSALLQYQMSQ
ncbi:hypothetical protein BLNAU_5182 [Blattamonas nauphoetae]|uniref:Uncharacterized protein n=1 Tax=Blattamonas nauphoetae TaxID=2049346 RepID=A0ABQ9Y8C3_9EUKA|nr:hypothetical protein BLNAU_5182 [Blattamonas nauphoetae]